MRIKFLSKNFYISFLIVISIFIIDRISKIYVIFLEKKNNISEIFLSKFLNIHLVWNEGIAFGLFNFEKSNLYNILTFFIFLIILLIIYMSYHSKGFKRYSLLMIIGGALGNIFDRIFSKAVPDFIDFHVGNFHWFIFNIADIFITLGVIFMIMLEFINNKENE